MTQTIQATYGTYALASVDFNLVHGVSPGSGTITFQGVPEILPPGKATLYMTDGTDSVTLQNIYMVNPRIESSTEGGAFLTSTIYDRRYCWKWGYVTGTYNKQGVDGVPEEQYTLTQLMELCFAQLGESNYTFVNIPIAYPEVNWEYENPGNALQSLLDKYGLTIGIDPTDNSGAFVVAPYNYARTVPLGAVMSTTEVSSKNILPAYVRLVGDRKILQETFVELVPVGEDTDGTIKNIDDLSYAPVGAGEGGEAYSYELWGKEAIAAFSNISNPRQRELAEKCVFKWFSIDWSVYEKDEVLPLLNEISEIITVEGVEKHGKPYITGNKTVWDGTEFKKIADQKIDSGYTIDKKLGIVKFTKIEHENLNSDGPTAGNFLIPDIDLVAAYESKLNTVDDFIWWRVAIIGGTELEAVHIEDSLTSYYIDGVLQNETELNAYANEMLSRLEYLYTQDVPILVKYPGVWSYGAWGEILSVKYSASTDNGAETEIQRGLEVPDINMDDFQERLNKRKIKLDFTRNNREEKTKKRRTKSTGAVQDQPRDEGELPHEDMAGSNATKAGGIVRAKNTYAGEIPAKSFVEITGYDATNRLWEITRPSSIGAKNTAFVQEAIPENKNGTIYVGGLHVVTKDAEYTSPVVGDVVGTNKDTFTAVKTDTGNYVITKIVTNDLYLRPIGGGGGGVAQTAIVTQVPEYNNVLKDMFIVQKASVVGDEWVGDGDDITIERAFGFEGFVSHEGTNDAKDIRNWSPWPPVGSIINIVEKWDAEQVTPANRWYMTGIGVPSIYGGKESISNIRVDDETLITRVVWA